MMNRQETVWSMRMVVTVGFVVALVMTGCAKKNVLATNSENTPAVSPAQPHSSSTEGLGTPQGMGQGTTSGDSMPSPSRSQGPEGGLKSARADLPAEGAFSLPDIGGSALQGFSKAPQDETLKPGMPILVAKAGPTATSPELRQASAGQKRILADIYFAFDRWELSKEGQKNLAESAGFLKQHPEVKLLIEGHCDERGSREYNLVLGEKRAKETRQYLADLGLKNTVMVTSYGKERPTCAERDESCYWKNRRAHLMLEESK